MIFRNLLLFFSMVTLTTVSGCYYDNEEELFGTDECDLSGVTYSDDVVSLLVGRCYECHDQANHEDRGSGIRLDGYSRLKSYVDDGSFLGSIKQESGYSPMPKGGSLDECMIDKIEQWILDGALDN